MRKIDKTQILSTEYKKWEEYFETNDLPHAKYNSSANEFYFDVVLNLLYCQKGLCAYTEVQLCDQKYLLSENWENGKYKFTEKPFNGELEHFDETLKSKQKELVGKKDWLWDNLFIVDSDTNNRKGAKKVDSILKPDSESYNEFELLDYNTDTHIFHANFLLPEEEQAKIEYMLDILGINFPNLISKRKRKIEAAFEFGVNFSENEEFPTAYEFYRRAISKR